MNHSDDDRYIRRAKTAELLGLLNFVTIVQVCNHVISGDGSCAETKALGNPGMGRLLAKRYKRQGATMISREIVLGWFEMCVCLKKREVGNLP